MSFDIIDEEDDIMDQVGTQTIIKEIQVKDVKAKIREGTSDEFVVNEVIGGGEYRKLKLQPSDIVLDFGLNIGMFTIQTFKRGVKEIHSFEPDFDNFNLATDNCKLNNTDSSVQLNNAAVVGNNDTTRNFSINTKKNKGAHSLVAKNGRDTITVNTQNINDIMKRVNPTVIKMDIEGGEYEVIPAITDWSNVRELIMEYHHAHLLDKDMKKFHRLLSILQSHFSHVEYRKEPKGAWVSIIYCSQELDNDLEKYPIIEYVEPEPEVFDNLFDS